MKDDTPITIAPRTLSRTFGYQKNNVTLSFTLRVDVKHELQSFLECLEAAVIDVTNEINLK